MHAEAADGHLLLTETAHVGAESNGAELVPAVDQATEDEAGQRQRHLDTAGFEGDRGGEGEGDLARGWIAVQHVLGGQCLVGGAPAPWVLCVVAGGAGYGKGMSVECEGSGWLGEECGVEGLAGALVEASDPHVVVFGGRDGRALTVASPIEDAGAGDGLGAVSGVDGLGQVGIDTGEVFERYGVDGASYVAGEEGLLFRA